jgi:hypothetical protein
MTDDNDTTSFTLDQADEEVLTHRVAAPSIASSGTVQVRISSPAWSRVAM